MGFCFGKNTYLKSGWNKLDFFVVLTGIWTLSSGTNVGVIRTIRLLRPLRSINKVRGISDLVSAFIESIPPLLNVTIFLIFIISLFAIFGLHLFNGMFEYRCRTTELPDPNTGEWKPIDDHPFLCSVEQQNCPEGSWCGAPRDYDLPWDRTEILIPEFNYGCTNFDWIFGAMYSILQFMTGEGWSVMMYIMWDHYNSFLIFIFFFANIYFGVFFVFNLFIAILSDSYIQVRRQANNKEFREKEANQQIQKSLVSAFKGIKKKREVERRKSHSYSNILPETSKKIDQKDLRTESKRSTAKIQRKDNGNKGGKSKYILKLPTKETHTTDIITVQSSLQKSSPKKQVKFAIDIIDEQKESEIQPEFNNSQLNAESNSSVISADSYKIENINVPSIKNNNQNNQNNNEKSKEESQDNQKNQEISQIKRIINLKAIVKKNKETIKRTKTQRKSQILRKRFMNKMIRTQEDQNKNFLKIIIFNQCFVVLILGSILCNTIILSLESYKNKPSTQRFLISANKFFSYLFTVEMIIKIKGLGIKQYVRDGYNLFDGLLVMISMVEINLAMLIDDEAPGSNQTGAKTIQAFRVLRLLRVFKLASKYEGLVILIEAIQETVKDVAYFSLLIFLYVFICALVGMDFFAYRIHVDNQFDQNPVQEGGVSPRLNFDDFWNSILTIFALLVNEDWNLTLYIFQESYTNKYFAYFYILFVVCFGNFLLLQLFLAIRINKFSEAIEESENKRKFLKQPIKNKNGKKIKDVNKLVMMKLGELKKTQSIKVQQDKNYIPLVVPEHQDDTKNILYHLMLRRKEEYERHIKNHKVLEEQKQRKRVLKPNKGKSLCLFGERNWLRKKIYMLVLNNYFEGFIIFVIFISTVSLMFQTPLKDPDSSEMKVWQKVDYATTIIFTLETLLKIFAFGFLFNGEWSYLRQLNNVFDFVIVLFAIVNILISGQGAAVLGKFKILRVVKTIRPLRLISRSVQLKIAIKSIITSIPSMLNLVIMVILFFYLFGIFGVNQFQGAYYVCGYDNVDEQFRELVTDRISCMDYGGDWIILDSNFDDILNAILTLFKVALTEGWIDIMNQAVDSQGFEMTTKRDFNQEWAIYFVVFIYIGSFFILNIFDNIIIHNYMQERNKYLGLKGQTEGQKLWISLLHKAGQQYPSYKIIRPKIQWKAKIYDFVTHQYFEGFIILIILINTICFMMKQSRQNADQEVFINYLSYIFLAIFLFEAFLKLLSMGLDYFYDDFNKFDFFIILITCSSLLIEKLFKIEIGSQSSVLRVFRLFRILRLITRASSLRMIFNTFIITLPSLLSIGLLLIIIQFIYTILGVELFCFIQWQENLNRNANFENFISSFLTLFRVSTGEGWNSVMDDMLRQLGPNYICQEISNYEDYKNQNFQISGCGNSAALLYMISFQFIYAIIFLNLFVAVILEGFEESSKFEAANLSDFYIEILKKKWHVFDPKATGLIEAKDLRGFVLKIQLPFQQFNIDQTIYKMYLPVFQFEPEKGQKPKNYFLFTDVLCALTHMSTQVDIRENELSKINVYNKLFMKIEKNRLKFINKIQGIKQHPEYNSSHYVLVRNFTRLRLKLVDQRMKRRLTLQQLKTYPMAQQKLLEFSSESESEISSQKSQKEKLDGEDPNNISNSEQEQ